MSPEFRKPYEDGDLHKALLSNGYYLVGETLYPGDRCIHGCYYKRPANEAEKRVIANCARVIPGLPNPERPERIEPAHWYVRGSDGNLYSNTDVAQGWCP